MPSGRQPVHTMRAGNTAATQLFESFTPSEREAVYILTRLHQCDVGGPLLSAACNGMFMFRTPSADTRSSSASPTPSPIITISEHPPADNEPAVVEAVILSGSKRKTSPVAVTSKRRRMSSGASGASALTLESINDDDSGSDSSRPFDSNSWTPYEVSLYDLMTQQVPSASRGTTNMFGGRLGRNELVAIYMALTVGGYFDRKRISSRNQASEKAKENECRAARIPYHKPVSVDSLVIPQQFRRLVCAAHYSTTGQLLDDASADLSHVPLPRVAVMKKDEVWILGDALKAKQEELAAKQQKGKEGTGSVKKAKKPKASIKYSSVPSKDLKAAPPGTQVFDSDEALAVYDAALSAKRNTGKHAPAPFTSASAASGPASSVSHATLPGVPAVRLDAGVV